MNLLIDTHALIWFLNGDSQLSEKARNAIEETGNNNVVSIASIYEIAIKLSLKRLRFPDGFNQFLSLIEENGFEILPISFEHALILSNLEFIQRDPFDRLLIAQCLCEGLTIVSKDEFIGRYPIPLIW
jgi:PIN domain nuclease of toxin-antitoxin system